MDDLIQLAAYVLIIVVIGAASIIKKVIEAQKRRQEIEKHRVKTLQPERELFPKYTQEQTPSYPPAPEKIPQEEIQEGEPIEWEDVLKKVLGIPEEKPVLLIKHKPNILGTPRIRKEEVPLVTAKPISLKQDTIQELKQEDTERLLNWEEFTNNLKNQGLSEIQQAIIISDLIQPSVARRARRHLGR
jgi:hypothetical protein